MLKVTDRTRPVRVPVLVLGALCLALLALFALPAAPQATGGTDVSGEPDRMTSRRPRARQDALQTVERSGRRKLSTLLVVALVAAAFVLGLASGTFIGGSDKSNSESRGRSTSTPATGSPAGTSSKTATRRHASASLPVSIGSSTAPKPAATRVRTVPQRMTTRPAAPKREPSASGPATANHAATPPAAAAPSPASTPAPATTIPATASNPVPEPGTAAVAPNPDAPPTPATAPRSSSTTIPVPVPNPDATSNPAASPIPATGPNPAAMTPAAAPSNAALPNSAVAPSPGAAPSPAAAPNRAAAPKQAAVLNPSASAPAIATGAAGITPSARPALTSEYALNPVATTMAEVGSGSSAAGTMSTASAQPIVAACKHLHGLLGSPTSTKLELERICSEDASADMPEPQGVVEELCVLLVTAAPMFDEQQMLASCHIKYGRLLAAAP
jgi:hypothetical protein